VRLLNDIWNICAHQHFASSDAEIPGVFTSRSIRHVATTGVPSALENHCGMVDAGCNIWNWQRCCEFRLDLEIVADQLGLTCA
jgi:hypothetical protein